MLRFSSGAQRSIFSDIIKHTDDNTDKEVHKARHKECAQSFHTFSGCITLLPPFCVHLEAPQTQAFMVFMEVPLYSHEKIKLLAIGDSLSLQPLSPPQDWGIVLTVPTL